MRPANKSTARALRALRVSSPVRVQPLRGEALTRSYLDFEPYGSSCCAAVAASWFFDFEQRESSRYVAVRGLLASACHCADSWLFDFELYESSHCLAVR